MHDIFLQTVFIFYTTPKLIQTIILFLQTYFIRARNTGRLTQSAQRRALDVRRSTYGARCEALDAGRLTDLQLPPQPSTQFPQPSKNQLQTVQSSVLHHLPQLLLHENKFSNIIALPPLNNLSSSGEETQSNNALPQFLHALIPLG